MEFPPIKNQALFLDPGGFLSMELPPINQALFRHFGGFLSMELPPIKIKRFLDTLVGSYQWNSLL